MNTTIFSYSIKFLGILFVILGISEIPLVLLIKGNFFADENIVTNLQLVFKVVPYIIFGLYIFYNTGVLHAILIPKNSKKSKSTDIEYSLVGVGVILIGIYFFARGLFIYQFFLADIINFSTFTLTHSEFYIKIICVIIPLIMVFMWNYIADLILLERVKSTGDKN